MTAAHRGRLTLPALTLTTLLTAALTTLVCALPTSAAAAEQGVLAIVIDDLGWNHAAGARALALPGPLTVAVLPGTPVGAELAAEAVAGGREVILHQPMASMQPVNLGPDALTDDLTEARLRAIVAANLEQLPELSGVSNHMGSLLTTRAEPMAWLMQELTGRDLYFLDSRTTPMTLAQDTARAHAIPALRRDVFLDVVIETGAIEMALEQAVQLAERRGWAIAIGHPHTATLEVLEARLPQLGHRVRLVPLHEILKAQNRATPATLAAD